MILKTIIKKQTVHLKVGKDDNNYLLEKDKWMKDKHRERPCTLCCKENEN
jgi:hypothetical protein